MRATLLIHCPDRGGLVAAVTDFIAKNKGNILDLDEHVDPSEGVFFMRVEWDLKNFKISPDKIKAKFKERIAKKFKMEFQFFLSNQRPCMVVFVSKRAHCLYDILARCESGEWEVDIPFIIGNHREMESVAQRFDKEFYHFPIDSQNKHFQEKRQMSLLRLFKVDFVVLARYMQIVGPPLMRNLTNRIINIHHSFLPAFPGGKPYHKAYERGVKIIGATSHYATSRLDQGPIIEQDVVRVSHEDTVEDMMRKGRDLEKVVLARAIYSHLRHKILVYGNRTIHF